MKIVKSAALKLCKKDSLELFINIRWIPCLCFCKIATKDTLKAFDDFKNKQQKCIK